MNARAETASPPSHPDPAAYARPSLLTTLAAVALCAAAYLYVFPYQPKINNPNENVRFYMTAAIVEEGTYAIDTQRRRWGWVNDAGVRDDKHYSVKAPGTSLLGVPGYFAYHALCQARGVPVDRTTALWVCRLTASILPSLWFLFAFHRFLGRYTRSALLRDAAFFSVALGSLFYGYALLFVSHTLSAVVAFGTLLCLEGHSPKSHARAFTAGLLASSVTLFEYPGLMASAPLAVYALVRVSARRALSLCLGGLLPVLAMMHFQWRAFGHPFTPGHRYLENQAFRALSEEGFFGATGFRADAAVDLLFDPGFGLFMLTPFLLLGALCVPLTLQRRDLRSAVLASVAVCLLSYLAICVMNNWRGGWTIGARYLAVTVPFLAWLGVVGVDALSARFRSLGLGTALGFTATGLVLSGLPSAYYPHLPEALTRPIPDLIMPLVHHDFAPFNAGAFVGVHGTISMGPLFALLAAALAWLLVQALHTAGAARSFALVASATLAFAFSTWPAWARGSETKESQKALAFVTQSWTPEGHDALSKLLSFEESARDAVWAQRVITVYRALGRERDAQALARKMHLVLPERD